MATRVDFHKLNSEDLVSAGQKTGTTNKVAEKRHTKSYTKNHQNNNNDQQHMAMAIYGHSIIDQ